MNAYFSEQLLWPTRLGIYEADPAWEIHQELYDYAVSSVQDGSRNASERRVRGILDEHEAGLVLKDHLFSCARHFLGEWGKYLDPDHCENRALVIGNGAFISTHKDSREGDLSMVYFLTGGGEGQPINSVGNPRFVVEDPSRYFDEGRLPFEERHGFLVNPRPGLGIAFPSHIPHNQHPYTGEKDHVQIVANFRVELPTNVEEELFD